MYSNVVPRRSARSREVPRSRPRSPTKSHEVVHEVPRSPTKSACIPRRPPRRPTKSQTRIRDADTQDMVALTETTAGTRSTLCRRGAQPRSATHVHESLTAARRSRSRADGLYDRPGYGLPGTPGRHRRPGAGLEGQEVLQKPCSGCGVEVLSMTTA